MKTTITVLLALFSFGIFAFVQLVQGEDKPIAVGPPKVDPPKQVAPREAPPNATPAQIQHLLRLREKVGSKLQGKLLESDPKASQDDFAKALEEVRQQRQSEGADAAINTRNIDQNVTPAEFSPQKLPPDVLPSAPLNPISDDKLLSMMRSTSMALDHRAGQLELIRDFENAQRLRKQAKKLRKQAILIESLNTEQAAITVEK